VSTRFEGAKGSNPEELLGAALTGCFSMAMSLALERAGLKPESIRTSAQVHLEKHGDGFAIPRIDLATEVKAQGDTSQIRAIAHEVEKQCIVSKALAGVTIALTDVKVV
jgi:osmotically inducible protein OsmC